MRCSLSQVSFLLLHLLSISEVLCPDTSSGGAGIQPITDKSQDTAAQPPYTSRQSREAQRTDNNDARSQQMSTYTRRLTQDHSIPRQTGNVDCSLCLSQREQIHNITMTSTTWVVTETCLSETGPLQSIIDCTKENDTILFRDFQNTRILSETITIRWNLTLSAYVEDNLLRGGKIVQAKNKVSFSCPSDGPLILAKTPTFTIANLIFLGCRKQGTIISVDALEHDESQPRGKILVRHVAFENNTFSDDQKILDARNVSCSHLVMEHVVLKENKCHEDGCIVLSVDNRLEDIEITENNRDQSSLSVSVFYAPSDSVTSAVNITARDNSIRVFALVGSELSLSESACHSGKINRNSSRERGQPCDGGVILSDNSTVNIGNSTFANNSGFRGGVIYGTSSKLLVEDCSFLDNSADENGGGMSIKSSNLSLKRTTFEGNEAGDSCGGICLSESSILKASFTEVRFNSAKDIAGGMGILDNSSCLCYSCQFKNNTALDGAGIYIRLKTETRRIYAQLQDCSFFGNNATLSGGGLMFEAPQHAPRQCSERDAPCGRIVLLNTSFTNNSAGLAGSAFLVTDREDVLVSCSYDEGRKDYFLGHGELGALIYIYPKGWCLSWLYNSERSEGAGGIIATLGKRLTLTLEDNSTVHLVLNSNNFSLGPLQSWQKIPKFWIHAMDAFEYAPAPTIPRSFLVKITPINSSTRRIETSKMNDNSISVYETDLMRKPGKYFFVLTPRIATIENSTLVVRVRDCLIGEEPVQKELGICQDCGDQAYNFTPNVTHGCSRCPDSAICEGRYIIPEDGYWHNNPCQDNIKSCIVEAACSYTCKSRYLDSHVHEQQTCKITNTTLRRYQNHQCQEGYHGVLCGSCERYYGRSANFECKRCGYLILSILRFLGCIFYLCIGTALTIKGTLPIITRPLIRQDAMAPLLVSTNPIPTVESSSIRVEEEIQEELGGSEVATNEEQAISLHVPSHLAQGLALAQSNVVETWKILLNFFQVTSTAAIMDVKWTKKMLHLFEALRLMGIATMNAVSQPVDCIVTESSLRERVLMQYMFSLFLPVMVILVFSIFWGYHSILVHGLEDLYFLKRIILTVVTITYITYFDVTQLAVTVFHCIDVCNNENPFVDSKTSYWIADTSIKCFNSTHHILMGISLVVLMTVSICFPLACSLALYKSRHNVEHINSWAHETLGLLCGPFKKRFVFWECITMIKKAILSIIIVFAYSLGKQVQGLLVSLVLLSFLALHSSCYPFKQEFHMLNYYEIGSLVTSCATYITVQFFNIKTLSEDARIVVSVSLIILNGGFVAFMAFLIARNLIQLARAVLLARKVEVSDGIGWFSILKLYLKKRRSNEAASLS